MVWGLLGALRAAPPCTCPKGTLRHLGGCPPTQGVGKATCRLWAHTEGCSIWVVGPHTMGLCMPNEIVARPKQVGGHGGL